MDTLSPSQSQNFFTKTKNKFFNLDPKIRSIVVLAVLLLAIPLTVWLLQRTQIFAPKAVEPPIQLVIGEDSCAISNDPYKVSCASFPIKLTSPLGPIPDGSFSCNTTEDCPIGNTCYKFSDAPGVCRNTSAVCTQVETRACKDDVCLNFPSPCHVPLDWTLTPESTPSASIAASPVCTTLATTKNAVPIDNQTIQGNYAYPAGTKIKSISLPAKTGLSYELVGLQTAGVGQPLSYSSDEGLSSFSIKIKNQTACGPFDVFFTMINSCGTSMPDWIGVGSASGYGQFCAAFPSPSPAVTPLPGITSSTVTSAGNFRLVGSGQCTGGSPTIDLVWDRTDGGPYTIEKTPTPIPAQMAGQLTLRPILSTFNGVALNTTYSIYIQSVNGPKSDTISISSPATCAGADAGQANPLFKKIAESLEYFRNLIPFAMAHDVGISGISVNCSGPSVSISWPANSEHNMDVFRTGPGGDIKVGEGNGGFVDTTVQRGNSYSYYIGHGSNATNTSAGANVTCITPSPSAAASVAPSPSAAASVQPSPSAVASIAPSPGASVAASPSTVASPSTTTNVCTNLVKNNSFENPVIVNLAAENKWIDFGAATNSDSTTTQIVADWDPRAANTGYQVELQHAIWGDASEGKQYAEIDIPGIVSLTQSIPTQQGEEYEIKFDYSSRPDMPIEMKQKLGIYWNGELVETIDGTKAGGAGQQVDWEEHTFIVTAGAGATSKLGFGSSADSQGGGGNFIDNISVVQTSGECGDQESPSPSPDENLPGTLFYQIAETEAGLANAEQVPYLSHPIFTDLTFSDPSPGFKQIWVRFTGPGDAVETRNISVEIITPPPVVDSLACSVDISKQNLLLTITGKRLGNGSGKVTVNTKDADITSWNLTQVTASIKPGENLDDGKLFKVVLTLDDDTVMPEQSCLVNTTVLSLGARLFCRAPGAFDVNNVKVTLVDANGNKVDEAVSIDKDGLIKNLKTKLKVGDRYAVSVKAPYSLRRNALFTAADGTNVISAEDDSNFILPVGDIAPVILSDGKINTLDRSEIVRQWSVLGVLQGKTADFNRDSKVNSIDWACMRYDFNKEDDPLPTTASTPAPSPTPTGSVIGDPCGPGGIGPCPSPSVGTREAFFVLAPQGSGSYPANTEFKVDLNIVSLNEASNLFRADIDFDSSVLEVVRIEKGTGFTNFPSEFFENDEGTISLIADKAPPGITTAEDQDKLMATIVFKGKTPSDSTPIVLTQTSKIYSNSDNENILVELGSAAVAITAP